MIASGQIVVTAPQGYQVFDQGGYTYIGTSVPEPSTWILAACAAAGIMVARRSRRATGAGGQ
jgi:hypothetical protein